MNIKEIIDQIGGRDRLDALIDDEDCRVTVVEQELLAQIALAVLDAKPVAFTDDEGLRNVKNGTFGEMFNGDYIDKFDGQWLGVYLTPPAASVPDVTFDPAKPGSEATVITHYFTPAGWKLVPVIPTWSMLSADGCSKHHNGQECSHHENRKRIWSAMLAAAPAPGGEQ